VFRSLGRIWWLLALCGIMDAMCAAMNLSMLNPDTSLGIRGFALSNVVWDMSLLALVAGACAIGAGLRNLGRHSSWLLSLHGLALAAFGWIGISPLVKTPLSFRPISLLFVLMAVSVSAFSFWAAQMPQSGAGDRWFFRVSAVASIGFAFSFLAVSLGWVKMVPPPLFWIWMSSYFGLCAAFMLYLALRGRSHGAAEPGHSEVPPPIHNLRHAH